MADDLRQRYAYALAQAIYKHPDPSWCLLEVCLPYTDAVLAVRDEELEDLRGEITLTEQHFANHVADTLVVIRRTSDRAEAAERRLTAEEAAAEKLRRQRDRLIAKLGRVRNLLADHWAEIPVDLRDILAALEGHGQALTADGAEPLLDPDCRDGKCSSCIGGPCEHDCHTKETSDAH